MNGSSSGLAPSIKPILACTLLLVVFTGTCDARKRHDQPDAQFKALDKNRDGVVSRDEFEGSGAFAAMDTDRNNHISVDELERSIGPQYDGEPSAAQRLAVADHNGNQELSDEEVRRALDNRFHWLDTNQDGKVELPEFRAGFGVPITHH